MESHCSRMRTDGIAHAAHALGEIRLLGRTFLAGHLRPRLVFFITLFLFPMLQHLLYVFAMGLSLFLNLRNVRHRLQCECRNG